MLRHARASGHTDLLRLAVSARTLDRIPYADELISSGAVVALTREQRHSRPPGRITAAELSGLVPSEGPCFVCGSNAFAEGATGLLAELGVDVARIRVERFGPSA